MSIDAPSLTAAQIAALRKDYMQRALNEAEVDPDPIRQFAIWFDEAAHSGAVTEPNAMVLSTADAEGQPRGRFVLLKGFDARGFVFFTNQESAKGRALAGNPRAALTFGWIPLERQVCIEGAVTKMERGAVEAYFATRPRGSRLGAWASPQSEVIPDRAVLEENLRAAGARFPGETPVILSRRSGSNSGRGGRTGCTIGCVIGARAGVGSWSGWRRRRARSAVAFGLRPKGCHPELVEGSDTQPPRRGMRPVLWDGRMRRTKKECLVLRLRCAPLRMTAARRAKATDWPRISFHPDCQLEAAS
jgi:pyridoxamine 5'-phosphate oxidase